MMNNKMNPNIRDTEDHLYPEVYHKCVPIAEQLIKDMEKQNSYIYLNENLLQQMIDEAIRRSDIDDITTEAEAADDAIPTIYEFGRGRGRSGHESWRHYDRGALSDIFKILFLQQIFGRRRPHWRWR